MKKSILLVSLVLAAAVLAGCSHPDDLLEVASSSVAASQA